MLCTQNSVLYGGLLLEMICHDCIAVLAVDVALKPKNWQMPISLEQTKKRIEALIFLLQTDKEQYILIHSIII